MHTQKYQMALGSLRQQRCPFCLCTVSAPHPPPATWPRAPPSPLIPAEHAGPPRAAQIHRTFSRLLAGHRGRSDPMTRAPLISVHPSLVLHRRRAPQYWPRKPKPKLIKPKGLHRRTEAASPSRGPTRRPCIPQPTRTLHGCLHHPSGSKPVPQGVASSSQILFVQTVP